MVTSRQLLSRVRRTIARHRLVRKTDRIAIALSGGSDSVALTLLLRDLAGTDAVQIAGLIHVNHGLRGDEAARDESFCRELAARLAWPIDVAHVDAGAASRERGVSIETAARDLRYECFTLAAARLGATRVATGHTLDDQAETVLLRLLRGASLRGVAGIRFRRGMFVRPLLECRQTDLRRDLARRGEKFCEDSSNRNEAFARNRIRHSVMPVIERVAPGGVRALARFAELAGEDDVMLNGAANEAAADVVQSVESGVQLNREALAKLPAPIARRLVRSALEATAPRGFSARHIGAMLDLATSARRVGRLDLPDVQVECGPTFIVSKTNVGAGFSRPSVGPAKTGPYATPITLTVPGAAEADGVRITATSASGAGAMAPAELRGDVVTLQAVALQLPLAVRYRRRGDRLRPLGAPGRRKLQDLFVDRKTPRQDRDLVPLVVDAGDKIVWVVGHTIAHECRVTAPEAAVVVLKVERTRNP